jgi:hypothetical protein
MRGFGIMHWAAEFEYFNQLHIPCPLGDNIISNSCHLSNSTAYYDVVARLVPYGTVF